MNMTPDAQLASPTAVPSQPQYAGQKANADSREPVRLTFSQHSLSRQQYDELGHSGALKAPKQTWPRMSAQSLHIRSDSQPQLAYTAAEQRASLGPSFVNSTMSSRPSQGSLSHKKSGGLRATIKRVFGSKRQRPHIEGVPQDIEYSDPGNLIGKATSPSEKQRQIGSYRRSHSLTRPVTRSSALRSHAPESPSQDQARDPVVHESSPRRRNTLPSLLLSDQEAQDFARSLNSQSNQVDDTPPLPLNASLLEQRRSRSLEAILKQHQSQQPKALRQDREAAIAYWRKSILDDPLPLMTNTVSHDDETETQLDSPRLLRHAPQSIKPAQSFDFGLSVGDGPVDLEDRVNTLEVKMFDFEYAIAKLQGIELAKPTLQPRVARSKSSQDLLRRTSHHSASTESSARRLMSFSRPRPGNTAVNEPLEILVSDHDSRSDTIRPRTSHGLQTHRAQSPRTTSVHITRDEYDSLVTLIRDEKAARQQIEMQLMNLQKEVEQLSAPIYAAIKYPMTEKKDQRGPPRVKTLHRTPPFDFGRISPRSPQASRISMDTETEFHSDDYHESYETPRERYTFDISGASPRHGVTVV